MIQEAAEYTYGWCDENHMQLNTTKTKSIMFTLRKNITTESITINSATIEEVNNTKLLGDLPCLLVANYNKRISNSDDYLLAVFGICCCQC